VTVDDHCFEPSAHPSIREYIDKIRQGSDLEEAIVRFDRDVARYLQEQKYLNGFVSEEMQDKEVRMKFLTSNMYHFGRWLLTFTNRVQVESPAILRTTMRELAEKISAHYTAY
jgi:predicted DNA-binding transcriptional regulator YafY